MLRWYESRLPGDDELATGRLTATSAAEASTGSDLVTWGEFVELGYLREYRRARVTLQHIRPVIERLRQEFGVRYLLAHAQPLIYDRQLVLRIQEEANLHRSLAIVLRSGQELILAREVEAYLQKVEFADDVVARIRPAGKTSPVVIDPDFSFGRPSIRGVATERIAELYRSGDSADFLAETYELPIGDVHAAIAYESTWDTLRLLVTQRDSIERHLTANRIGPWLAAVTKQGVRPLAIRGTPTSDLS